MEGSDWLRDFHRESSGIAEGEQLVHYAVYTDDDCIDIISAAPPIAERLPLPPGGAKERRG